MQPTKRKEEKMKSMFQEVISVYTREDAIADGVLIDVTETAIEAGFLFPVAISSTAWSDCVAWDKQDSKRQEIFQDENGRLWDVIYMARLAINSNKDSSQLLYTVYRVPKGGKAKKPRATQLKMIIGPGDNMEPVITIVLPNED